MAVVALSALVAGACAESPALPTAPSAVLSRGAVPQAGSPVAADPLPGPNALGATRFMAFGDSITQGITSGFDGALFDAGIAVSYPYQLQSLLTTSFPAQAFAVENRGVGGEEVLRVGSRFAQAMAAVRPQGLLLLEGINDLNNGATIPAVVNGLSQFIDIARLYNTTVLVGTMFQTCYSEDPRTGQVRPNSTEKIVPFNAAIRAMAAGRQNVYVVDLYAAFGNNCGGNGNGGVGLLGGDGLHPSPTGYSVMASTFGTAMRERFAVRGSYQ